MITSPPPQLPSVAGNPPRLRDRRCPSPARLSRDRGCQRSLSDGLHFAALWLSECAGSRAIHRASPPPVVAPVVPKPHQFSVVDGTGGLIALRDDGKSCRTTDLICVKKGGSITKEGRSINGVSCAQLALTPLCSDLDKTANDPLGIR